MKHISFSRKTFVFFNVIFLSALGLICLLPFIHVLAVSFSSNAAAMGGFVKLWPVEFTTKSYVFVLQNKEFLAALVISCERVILGVLVNMLIIVITAYPLSKEVKAFRARTVFVWFFVFTILFSGGLIPWYMTINKLGLINSIWALILPGAVPVFNILLVMNFFRSLPKELAEAAYIDGAGHWSVLFRIFLPTSIPVLATVVLFNMVSHWNAWFDGMVLMNTPKKYPFQTYMQTIIISSTGIKLKGEIDPAMLSALSERTIKATQIFLGALPILIAYPFLQRFFMKGIVLGSVKE